MSEQIGSCAFQDEQLDQIGQVATDTAKSMTELAGTYEKNDDKDVRVQVESLRQTAMTHTMVASLCQELLVIRVQFRENLRRAHRHHVRMNALEGENARLRHEAAGLKKAGA